MRFRPSPRSQGMMQCLADPNLLKPYISLGPLKPFQFPMRSFAQKDRMICYNKLISGVTILLTSLAHLYILVSWLKM